MTGIDLERFPIGDGCIFPAPLPPDPMAPAPLGLEGPIDLLAGPDLAPLPGG